MRRIYAKKNTLSCFLIQNKEYGPTINDFMLKSQDSTEIIRFSFEMLKLLGHQRILF